MQIYAAYNRPFYKRTALTKTMLIVLFIIVLFISFGATALFLRSPAPVSPVSTSIYSASKPYISKSPTQSKNPGELKVNIIDALDESIPEYSILIEDFLSSFQLKMGNSSLYTGASIHKLAILTAVYNAVEKGELTLDQKILFKEESRQDYGTGVLRYQKSGKEYTVKELLTYMMKKSDNTAAYIFAHDVLNMRDIQTVINNHGLTETSMTDNMTSNKDMALLMRKLFTGQLFNAALTRDAIDLLHSSDFEDRLPALLPNTARVYHKIGTTIAGLHDIGVVVTPNSMYYIGIFTRGVSDEERATKAIARVSRAVYDFMERHEVN